MNVQLQIAIRQKLEENGLFEEEAGGILKQLKENTPDMKGRWEDGTEDYPPAMFVVLWVSAKKEAVKWIEQNKPLHLAKSMSES